MTAAKHLLLASLLLLLGLHVRGQVLWEKTWGGPYDDGCEVRNTADGGMIVMGSYFTNDSWLMRLDVNGDTLWTTRVTQPYDLCSVLETFDGGFLTTGVTRTPNRDIVAWKFDLRGDSVWRHVYVDSQFTEGMYSVVQQPDSSFLISGYTSANGYDMFAIHIDSIGNELWRHRYGGTGFEGGTTPAPTEDGGYVFTTTTSTSNLSNIWVVRVDSLGDTLWTRHVIEPHETGGPIPTVLRNGKIVVVGWLEQSGNYDNYVFCLDPQGNTLWSQRYPGIGFESRTARGLIEDRFGGLSFASSVDLTYGPSGNDFDIALIRLDTLGNVTAMYRVGHPDDEMPRYFEQTANGDYLFLGYSTSFIPQGQQMYLARLHPSGCLESFYDLAGPNQVTACPGDSIWVDAGPGFAQYLWSDGDTMQIRLLSQSDTLYVQATDSLGCLHFSSAIVAQVYDGPQFAWSQTANLTLQFDGMLADGIMPQWDFGDGGTASVTDTSHVYAQAGTYYVCLQAFVPNCGLESFCDSVTVTGTVGWTLGGVSKPQILPNPSTGQFLLTNPFPEELAFVLTDLQGKACLQGSAPPLSEVTIQASNLANGVYLLQISGATMAPETLRLVIAR